MAGTVFQKDAVDVSTLWRAIDTSTNEDYAGTEIAHDATGLTIGYYREGASAAVTAVTGGGTAPVDLANAAAAHADWGWCRVSGPIYRADFPDAAFADGADRIARWVTGVSGVTFVPVVLDLLTASDPTAASLTAAAIVAAEVAALDGFARDDAADTLSVNGSSFTTTQDGNNNITSITAV